MAFRRIGTERMAPRRTTRSVVLSTRLSLEETLLLAINEFRLSFKDFPAKLTQSVYLPSLAVCLFARLIPACWLTIPACFDHNNDFNNSGSIA